MRVIQGLYRVYIWVIFSLKGLYWGNIGVI